MLTIIGMSEEVSADVLADRFSTAPADGTVAERAASDRTWAFGHLIVDEAQEHSVMMWRLLARRCPSKSMTVVGDVAQTGSVAGSDSWSQVLDTFAEGRWQQAELTVNYRTPREIMDVAADVSPRSLPTCSHRAPYAMPARVRGRTAGSIHRSRRLRPADTRGVQPADGTTAVLVPEGSRQPSPSPTIRCFASWRSPARIPTNRLVLLEVRAAKGLEFDVVIVVDPQAILDGSAPWSQRFIRALTRATTRVVVVHPGALPTVLSRLSRRPAA